MASRSPHRIHEPFVAVAIVFALTTGLGLAAMLVAALALSLPPGAWWIASVQAHGHVQLYGWVGLFIIGVGLYFIPRLRGTVLARGELGPLALVCLGLGIAVRTLDQPLLGVLADRQALFSGWAELGRLGLITSALLELAGVALVMTMLLASFRRARPLGPDAPILPVRGWLLLAFLSFALCTLLNLLLAIEVFRIRGYLYLSSWDDVLTHLLLMGFILPVAIYLSVRNLPLGWLLWSSESRIQVLCGPVIAFDGIDENAPGK